MQIIFLGAPGVGKGTQAKILSSKLNIAHISTGDILREAIKNQTELGLKAKEIVDSGELVPDDIMGALVKEVLKEDRCANGFILDGFPRTLHQAGILDVIFEELGISNPCLIKLDADDEVIVERLSNRRTCSNCKSIVNLKDFTDHARCPVCNTENSLVMRKDDEKSVIEHRLIVYHKTTQPVIDHYKEIASLLIINGTGSIEEVSKNVFETVLKCSI